MIDQILEKGDSNKTRQQKKLKRAALLAIKRIEKNSDWAIFNIGWHDWLNVLQVDLFQKLILESVNQSIWQEIVHWIPQKIQVHNMLCTNIVLNVKTKTKKQSLYTTYCELVFFWGFQWTISFHIVGWLMQEWGLLKNIYL